MGSEQRPRRDTFSWSVNAVMPGRGRPRPNDGPVVEGTFWRLATGTPRRNRPTRCGPWATATSSFRRWRAAGVWGRILAALPSEADAKGGPDGSLRLLDGEQRQPRRRCQGNPRLRRQRRPADFQVRRFQGQRDRQAAGNGQDRDGVGDGVMDDSRPCLHSPPPDSDDPLCPRGFTTRC